ncbi:MAG: hypothetical protein OXL37_16225 [Chloroflexota bacterium]|nr:hypothetical protein [Chloroflexota bacterium]MDE2961448.1 hypothetical protein [Chloroflexota bacterium]
MSEITQIKTESDYEAALSRINELIHSAPGSPEDAELDRISDLVIQYEDEHYPMEEPEPNSMLEFMIDQLMVSREQLIPLAGGSDRLDAMLEGRAAITPEVAQLLHERSDIPIAFFLKTPAEPASTATSD